MKNINQEDIIVLVKEQEKTSVEVFHKLGQSLMTVFKKEQSTNNEMVEQELDVKGEVY